MNMIKRFIEVKKILSFIFDKYKWTLMEESIYFHEIVSHALICVEIKLFMVHLAKFHPANFFNFVFQIFSI